MNTHEILLTVQYITIAVLFVEILVVFFKWKNSIHSYLFLACIASFVSNMGYLLEMKATTEEAYISALKLSYVGRVWIVFAFFLFSGKLCGIKIPKWVIGTLVAVHLGIYMAVLDIGNSTLYYSDYSFINDPVYPSFRHSNGTLHDLLMGINAVLICISIYWIVREYRRDGSRTSRKRLVMLTISYGVQAFAFALQMTGMLSISEYYDLTMPGALLGTIFMLIGILGFSLLGTREIARDFAIDRISEGIIAVDNNGRIQYYNESAANIYPEFDAFFRAKQLKEGAAKVHTPYDIISFIEEAVQKGETLKVGDRIYTPEKNELVFKDESYGNLYALVDDTEHFRYMEELQVQRDIADSANEAKSKFLASMSHEIRTPINAILGMDEMILRESGEKPIRSYASDIMSAGRTLLSLINDILDLSKVEEGKMEIIPVQYDLTSLIGDLVNMTRPRADKKGLEFKVKADEHIPHLLIGDEIRVRQCAMNVLTNAVKYTEKGSVTLTISYEKKDDRHILLKIKVEDTGIGMKPEDMENLFSPYKRIEEKRNRSIEGTGLGMSITRQLLDLMGSKLDVESEYGKGSVFSFEVEQEVEKWEELGDYNVRYDCLAEGYEYHELFHAPDAKILVVDDTEVNLSVIKSLLKKTLIGIDTAASGKEAIDLASKSRYDLLFIDHMMPDMDGIETLSHIRESGECSGVPAVALTANAISGAREMYLSAGFDAYLSKPVDGRQLEKLLAAMLPAEKIKKAEAGAGETPEMKGTDGAGFSGSDNDDSSEDVHDLMTRLGSVPEIDSRAGLANCGSPDGYLSVLNVFHQTAPSKADEIEELYKKGDIENYTIKVHALKSSARIIGASDINKLALELEEAGKKKDMDFINANTAKLLDMYRGLDSKLSILDKKDEDLPGISEKSLKEAYQTIIEIAGSMDFGMMEDILKDLKGYALPEKDKLRISGIEARLNELDWDGIAEEARKAYN